MQPGRFPPQPPTPPGRPGAPRGFGIPPLPPATPPPRVPPASPPSAVVHSAALSLLAFTLLSAVALAAWFKVSPQPWSWKALVALCAAIASLTSCIVVWRTGTRPFALVGLAVMVLSLARIGPPSEWTLSTGALVFITVLLTAPLVRAAIVLPWSTRY